MHQGLSRLWLVPVLVFFCAPLFIGLGNTDLQNDEAIYSFAVDGILDTGDWLNPRSSPDLHVVFLEKPPLKFWIVALPIRLGLLPRSEYGLRFWDALFGAIAFIYVFAVGRRIAGPMCGLVAVLVLFADPDLIFEHGLRNNNMEAPLVLAYCGGVYHFLAWGSAASVRSRRWHAIAVGLYFFLGFMTKFVAALGTVVRWRHSAPGPRAGRARPRTSS
ncbi:MAG TPA: glycosyltransferase family 39 protein [Vicinamibacterales bacterium]|nr:glycosyltransferase family 39 protein [Vicinamibacterales bacterium]